ncbi:putative Acidic leucine-rich nuclear phosphoprotein 32 family member A [Hypsibius exemplaris]|uniref:Acidic leucine-rich nuclear phosphoprotein 32 family member A n=1 Tax=Hypsibius exemplaris TaxID=2072580 RepID=A0A1W0XDT4_HYPEX|nr:putative Acidic leucine-rich nuclear phosphoprotein 32 family member A [Hypsibius exemplaris]
MDSRIELERRGREPGSISQLILDNCRPNDTNIISEKLASYSGLHTLSMINTGLTTLKGFPHLPLLKKLDVSDNRITGGLNNIADSCPNLENLNLGGNRIKDYETLEPLKNLKELKHLDLYNSSITQADDYRDKIFLLLPQLNDLDGYDRDKKEVFDEDDEEDFAEGEEEDEDDSDESDGEQENGDGESDSNDVTNVTNGHDEDEDESEEEEDMDETNDSDGDDDDPIEVAPAEIPLVDLTRVSNPLQSEDDDDDEEEDDENDEEENGGDNDDDDDDDDGGGENEHDEVDDEEEDEDEENDGEAEEDVQISLAEELPLPEQRGQKRTHSDDEEEGDGGDDEVVV